MFKLNFAFPGGFWSTPSGLDPLEGLAQGGIQIDPLQLKQE